MTNTEAVLCMECENPIHSGEAFVVSGSGVWCSQECWEETHGQPWIGGSD